MKRKKIIGVAVLVLVVSFAAVGFWSLKDGAKEPPYLTVPVQKGNITQVVTATGSLSAVITVQVGSQVSGTIDKLYADWNSEVKAGQPVARINQDLFIAAVDQAKANLLAARASTAKAKVSLDDASRTFERNKELKKRDLIAQSDLDTSQTAYDGAVAQYEVNKAQENQSQAALNQANVNLANSTIRSPVDGIVVSRNIDVGQTVASSLQAPTLFLIANDLSKMQVDTNVSEGDVGNVVVGQDVTFAVDAFPTRPFKGKVLQIRNAPIMVQNVVTYDAVVGVNNEELLLKPGMTANVEFLVSRKEGVLKVPNAALRFRPPSERQPAQVAGGGQGAGAGGGGTGGNRGPGQGQGQGQRPLGREGRPNREGTVYVLRDQKPTPVRARLGISDGTSTEIIGDEIKEGEKVIVAVTGSGAQTSTPNPFGARGFFGS